ncbi:PHB depolymerase family esterase [Actinomadura sp. WMMB 499]|uniref:extracellular catalytic domain type 1 short-chain-length polyhydroxyalkanoate depolymerase n=1 Tax=Actinomadura sp. WMMB 499 TaxID=1219491 RepID=UPI0012469B98|nr:PHB depolymerase family esterase [Actinomadura sp. WMMB 499]QFG19886.1 PHB depolymerase family esterase [Actinomadura sp. WMMB 499]
MNLLRTSGRSLRGRALRAAAAALILAAAAAAWCADVPRAAAAPTGFHEVTDFGPNPGNLTMYAYVPESARPGAPVVVLFHGCGGDARDLDVNTGWRKYADTYGFTIVFPEQKEENVGSGGLIPHKCFSAWSEEDRTRAGDGEARSVVRMVEHMTEAYGADASRVFVTGYSGGGAATNVMLAAYPDVFKAGAVFFGMAYGCADSESVYFVTPPFGPCSGYFNFTSAREWGDRLRGAHPGYSGPRPPVQIWHGGSDPIIVPRSLEYQTAQWTNVFGIGRTPTSTTTPASGVTKRVYGSGRLETYLIDDMGHEPPVDPGAGAENCGTAGAGHDALCGPYHASRFFGLG